MTLTPSHIYLRFDKNIRPPFSFLHSHSAHFFRPYISQLEHFVLAKIHLPWFNELSPLLTYQPF